MSPNQGWLIEDQGKFENRDMDMPSIKSSMRYKHIVMIIKIMTNISTYMYSIVPSPLKMDERAVSFYIFFKLVDLSQAYNNPIKKISSFKNLITIYVSILICWYNYSNDLWYSNRIVSIYAPGVVWVTVWVLSEHTHLYSGRMQTTGLDRLAPPSQTWPTCITTHI